ncbi:PQQ-binding-like beta-propeller repeat protein, partial [bacterium]|nr:PQQ-binding-like beta-propeller repeat protein [bacterium]
MYIHEVNIMLKHIQPKKSFLFIVIQLIFVCSLQIHASEIDSVAKSILTSAGVQGGLVVHAGCGDGQLTAALHQNDGFLVHGLERDESQVKAARNYIQSLGMYGTISIDRWDGLTLPYIDNSVNLLVMEERGKVQPNEIRRVLCPKGVAFIKKNGQWSKTIKPRPGGMDEWTHYLYGPNNNAVSQDNEVRPLRHLQWIGGPKFSRHHDHMSSSSAIVSANNRNFYIFDEGSPVSIQLPSKWKLIARDAFNGKILWERDMGPWQTQLTRLKSGPASLPRRIVAIGDTVYVTLAIDAPVTALDAATGKTIRTYKGTRNTEEILFSNGILFLAIKDSPFDLSPKRRGYDSWLKKDTRRILAVEAASGTILWEKSWRWVAPVTLAVDDNQVCFFDGETIVSLHRESGEKQWQSETLGKNGPIPSYFAPTLVLYK